MIKYAAHSFYVFIWLFFLQKKNLQQGCQIGNNEILYRKVEAKPECIALNFTNKVHTVEMSHHVSLVKSLLIAQESHLMSCKYFITDNVLQNN